MNAHAKIADLERLNRFVDWYIGASKGDHYVYFTGLLAAARDYQPNDEPNPDKDEINRLANRLWDMMEDKKISLVQRRVSPMVCDYLAVKI